MLRPKDHRLGALTPSRVRVLGPIWIPPRPRYRLNSVNAFARPCAAHLRDRLERALSRSIITTEVFRRMAETPLGIDHELPSLEAEREHFWCAFRPNYAPLQSIFGRSAQPT